MYHISLNCIKSLTIHIEYQIKQYYFHISVFNIELNCVNSEAIQIEYRIGLF